MAENTNITNKLSFTRNIGIMVRVPGLKSGYPDIQNKMAQRRVREAEETGAKELVSACPFCYQGLLVGITAEEAPIHMRDITEILTRALGVADDEAEDKEDGEGKKEAAGTSD